MQSNCDSFCSTCSLGTTMIVPGGGLVGGSGHVPNTYNVNFEAGSATISCYDNAGAGKCGSPMAFANTIPGIDFDAAIPLAYWPPGWGQNGNCKECGITCSGTWGATSFVNYNQQPLCYNITSRTTNSTKTIRINDSCGKVP